MENMNVSLRLFCFIALLTSLKADECKENYGERISVSYAYEIGVQPCPYTIILNKISITWFKNDSTTPIPTERSMRIHQYKDKIWFIPSKVEDTGHYYCVVRNSTHCIKNRLTIKFVENNTNLCYNTQAAYKQKLPIAQDGNLVCPYLDFFKDENQVVSQVQWYKDCKPLFLDNVNLISKEEKLIIASVNTAHRGNYTCHTTYTHLGKQYRVSRTVDFNTTDSTIRKRPVIESPANETVEVDLGSQLQLLCNVTGWWDDEVYWKWNNSVIDEDDPVLLETFRLEKNPFTNRKDRIIAELNISEVQSRFYRYPFYCVTKNAQGLSEAYVQLICPAPDFKKHIIGVFVMLIVLVTCSVFIYKIFKIDIVLWYRDSCYIFLPPKVSDGKTYDAYILYPKTLEEGSTYDLDIFVFKILPEILERQWGYKLFICGRDDNVGEDIVEVTNENIKKSRRLIIILGRETSGFSWLGSSSEEQIAMYNALTQNGIKIVLLELEKIQDSEKMSESIKFIKQKQGSILWSGDIKEESQPANKKFWKNVRYHMPVQRHTPSSKSLLLPLARTNPQETLQRKGPLG